MSFPLGVIAYPAAAAPDDGNYTSKSRPVSRKSSKATSIESRPSTSRSLDRERSFLSKTKTEKTPSIPKSSRSWVSALTRERKPSLPTPEVPLLSDAKTERSASLSTVSDGTSPHDSFDFSSPTTSSNRCPSRPKHVPIVIPDLYSYVPAYLPEPGSGSFYYSTTSSSSPISPKRLTPPSYETRPASSRSSPRHVELKIPEFANPYARKHCALPPLTKPTTTSPYFDITQLSPPDMSEATPESSRTNTMDSNTSVPSPDKLYANDDGHASTSNLSAQSSQVSLVGMRSEYESASEAESTAEDDAADASGSHTPSQSTSSANPQVAPAASAANLSGLVCNVHRTTGKEPHPLVGATTTVLGDKLYVFGGRRLSRTKPQLTANLYELDLIRRHWTKLETKGDVPPPRYFHSVCALGDTKLVCYGGMSPAPAPELSAEAQAEVIVMSDVHIYDVPSRTWTRVSTPDAPQGRYAHCAAILPSAAVFGSRDAPTSALHHNPEGDNPNQGTLGVNIDGTGGAEMVVVGGQDSANHYIEQVSIFNLRSLKWTGTTGMGRSCGAYRSVVTPLTSMSAAQIGAGPHARSDLEEEDDDATPTTIGSGSPMLIYSNYNFLDVKLELQVRLTDGTLTEKPMQTAVSPPGLRFPNGGVIDNHFVVSGTFLTSSKQEYALWALDLRTLTWSRIDAGGSIFSQGSWNRGVLWSRRNAFVILGNRKRSLVDDYNNRRINFSNICVVELEAFGLYENPRTAEPNSAYLSASAIPPPLVPQQSKEDAAFGRLLSSAAEDIGALALNVKELADMDFLAIDGTRVPVNSRLISRRWGPHFVTLLRESLMSATGDSDAATLRPQASGHPSRNSSITITGSASVTSGGTTLTNNSNSIEAGVPDTRTAPPSTRPRLLYLPHTAPTLHALLHYLYTSTLPAPPHPLATPQIFCSLLQLARPYKIDGLLEATIERLHQCLDGRNAAAIFNAAAMGAGGGDSVHFTAAARSIPSEHIPIRTHSLAGLEGLLANGSGSRSTSGLRIDTEMANGRNPRNTLRPGELPTAHEDNEDEPMSAATDASMSESEMSLSSRLSRKENQDVWNGALSSVVGLQKRGLRGLMEGRRMRERGAGRDGLEAGRVGLGIA
ncbi:Protein ral2 [Pseudocercospora fuligena]|uniref:Protein ral2 n=1 Tax=Pseudocercospora fuligena TaxID=685502 RepID=A0A8H6VFJ4_9PEZI|nr:Protein ral2 [Pseudocercospora fuligena]